MNKWRYSQVVRQRSAKPSSPVQIRLPPCLKLTILTGRRGGIGRRAGLKIQCPLGRAGSTPAAGIEKEKNFFKKVVDT